jgi:hypothetical protein
MAKTSKGAKSKSTIADALRLGGKPVAASFAAKATDATKSMLTKRLQDVNSTRKQAAQLYGALRTSHAVDVEDPSNKKALDALLNHHTKLAAKKLAFPKVLVEAGAFFPGTISGTIVPPFDFADTIPTLLANVSNPTLSASANVNGQISASAVSAQARGFNGGSEYARVGIFFHAMTAGTLTISASPSYSFQWSTNSLNTTLVRSFGSVGLTIYGMNELAQIAASAGANYELWDEQSTGEIHLDFGFDVKKSLSVSLDVTHSLVYLCFVEVDAHVLGMGWPGSLATSMASATVPSISYQFVPRLVFEP